MFVFELHLFVSKPVQMCVTFIPVFVVIQGPVTNIFFFLESIKVLLSFFILNPSILPCVHVVMDL